MTTLDITSLILVPTPTIFAPRQTLRAPDGVAISSQVTANYVNLQISAVFGQLRGNTGRQGDQMETHTTKSWKKENSHVWSRSVKAFDQIWCPNKDRQTQTHLLTIRITWLPGNPMDTLGSPVMLRRAVRPHHLQSHGFESS